MQQPLVIQDLIVQPGHKEKGLLKVFNRPIGDLFGLPLLIVHGIQEGPLFAVVAGVHGDEFEGSEAVIRVWRELDPAKLCGTFVGVPSANPFAREAWSRVGFLDHIDLNRVFPGKEFGKPTERIAYVLFHEVVLQSQYLIDIHSGGVVLSHAPAVNYGEFNDEDLNKRILDLAKATGLPWLCNNGGPETTTGELPDAAMREGVVAINIEVGDEGRCREVGVETDLAVLRNLFKAVGMINGEPSQPAPTLLDATKGLLRVGTSGLWHHQPDLKPETWLKKGDLVGMVSDLYGNILETVTAPEDGIIIALRSFPAIHPGEWVTFLYPLLQKA